MRGPAITFDQIPRYINDSFNVAIDGYKKHGVGLVYHVTGSFVTGMIDYRELSQMSTANIIQLIQKAETEREKVLILDGDLNSIASMLVTLFDRGRVIVINRSQGFPPDVCRRADVAIVGWHGFKLCYNSRTHAGTRMPNNSHHKLMNDAYVDPEAMEPGRRASLATRLSEPVTPRDVKNVAYPTADKEQRWAGRGRKTPRRNWKRAKIGKQYERNL